MTTYAHNLDTIELPSQITLKVARQTGSDVLAIDDPAISVMTDLKKTRAITITPDKSIEFALQYMIQVGVRMLIVTDEQDTLVGLVTARDLMGEKPLNLIARDKIKREDVLVKQVMTPRDELNPMRMHDVEHARIRDIVIKLREVGRQHAIVIEQYEDNEDWFVRGIFSITQIGRQLGMEITTDGRVQSFSDFEKIIA